VKHYFLLPGKLYLTSCARGDTICPRPSPTPVGALAPRAPPSRRNVAALFHAEYLSTMTAAAALRVKAALSKAAWWPWPLSFDLLTLKVVSESRGTWALCVPILVFLGLSVLDLGPRYATDRQTDRRQTDVRQIDRQTDRQTSDKSIA